MSSKLEDVDGVAGDEAEAKSEGKSAGARDGSADTSDHESGKRGESHSPSPTPRMKVPAAPAEFMAELWDACEHGRVDVVTFLLPSLPDPNVLRPSTGATPLYTAARAGHGQVCGVLLADKRVDPTKPNKRGFSPFFAAALHGHVGVIQALATPEALARGVDVSVGLPNGFTPLHAAAQNNYPNVVERLARHPHVDVNKRAKSGATATYIAARKGSTSALMTLLNMKDVDPAKSTYAGNSPLFCSCLYGHLSAVKLLLANAKVDINAKNTDGCTAMWAAASRGHMDILRLLLEDGRMFPDTPDKVCDPPPCCKGVDKPCYPEGDVVPPTHTGWVYTAHGCCGERALRSVPPARRGHTRGAVASE